MKVFISWSGTRSRHVAEALRWWLPNVIQAIDPFMSSHDIRKGARGNVVISDNLEQANVGVICLTPENLDARWILFEAGALSKLSSAYVCTYLIDLTPSNVEPPISQFQHTAATKEETKALLDTINSELAENSLDSGRLNDAFETWWPRLDERLAAMPDRPEIEPAPEGRSDENKLDELLTLVRSMQSPRPRTTASAMPQRNTIAALTRRLEFENIAQRAKPLVNQLLFPLSNAKGRQSEVLVESSMIGPAIDQGLVQSNDGMISLTELGWAVVEYFT